MNFNIEVYHINKALTKGDHAPYKIKNIHDKFMKLRESPLDMIREYSLFYGDMLDFIEEYLGTHKKLDMDLAADLNYTMYVYAFYILGLDISCQSAKLRVNYAGLHYGGGVELNTDNFNYSGVIGAVLFNRTPEDADFIKTLKEMFMEDTDHRFREILHSLSHGYYDDDGISDMIEYCTSVIKLLNSKLFLGPYLSYLESLYAKYGEKVTK